MDELKISIAISTRNRSALLMRLVGSIVLQDYSNYEIVIVDDASIDDTEEVIERFMRANPSVTVKYYRNSQNLNASASKRRAYKACSGEVVIFSDDDDYYVDRSYFRRICNLYLRHDDCVMTIAPTVTHFEQEDRIVLNPLVVSVPLSTREYLNGFMTKYPKPASMFTLSMRASSIESVGYSQLRCFGDTPIYLFGLLAEGNVYALDQVVGVYSVRGDNMTRSPAAGFIIENLRAKFDIYEKACGFGLLEKPEKWLANQLRITADHYLLRSVDASGTDREVWGWMKSHLSASRYCGYVAHVFACRKRRRLPIDFVSVTRALRAAEVD